MNEQGRRMSRLVDDLLSLSRIEQRAHQPPSERVDLAAIIREIIDSLSVMASERGVAVIPRLAPARCLSRATATNCCGWSRI